MHPHILTLLWTSYMYIYMPISLLAGEACEGDAACEGPCGHCLDTATCNPDNGLCPSGCQLWWLGASCDTNIAVPDRTDESSHVFQISATSVMVVWQPLQTLPRVDNIYYHYLITYRAEGDLEDEKGPTVDHDSADTDTYLQAFLSGLRHDGMYQFRVWPFRSNGSVTDYGSPYRAVAYQLDEEDYMEGDGGSDDTDDCSPVPWYLFAVSCLINLGLGASIIYYIFYKKRSRKSGVVRMAPDPDLTDSSKYSEPPCTVETQSPAIVSGEYMEPVNYYKQHIVTPAPYERLESQFHQYENNGGPYQPLSANKLKTKPVYSNVQQLIKLHNREPTGTTEPGV